MLNNKRKCVIHEIILFTHKEVKKNPLSWEPLPLSFLHLSGDIEHGGYLQLGQRPEIPAGPPVDSGLSWRWLITSSVRGRIPPESCSLRYRRAEFIRPSNTRFAKILALFGVSFLRGFVRRFCIIRPSRRSISISPSFHRANLLDEHSWWSFAFEPWPGFCSASAKRTMVAVRPI